MLPKNVKSHDLIDKKVRVTRDIRNGAGVVVPKGTVVTVFDVSRGFTIRTDPCPCCGLYVHIRGITRDSVELIEETE